MSEKESPHPKNSNPAVRMFNAKELGLSLQCVAVDVVKSDAQNIQSHWYHSIKDADMFYWTNDKKNIIKQQLTFYGQMVEWSLLEGVRTGFLVEDEGSQRVEGSALIQFDSEPQQHAIEQCVDIITHIQGIVGADKFQLIQNFINSPTFPDLTPEEIIQRFGVGDRQGSGGSKENTSWLHRLLKTLRLSGKK